MTTDADAGKSIWFGQGAKERSTMIKQPIAFGVALAVLFLAGRASAQDHVCSQEGRFRAF
jgi:hypothetical protein